MSAEPSRLQLFLRDIRHVFLGRSRELPGEPGSLLEGMVLGDRSGNLPLFSSVMTTTSLRHLTAVSGKKICNFIWVQTEAILHISAGQSHFGYPSPLNCW